jgi:hypothetical protein
MTTRPMAEKGPLKRGLFLWAEGGGPAMRLFPSWRRPVRKEEYLLRHVGIQGAMNVALYLLIL